MKIKLKLLFGVIFTIIVICGCVACSFLSQNTDDCDHSFVEIYCDTFCTEYGTRQLACSKCGLEQTESVDPTGHDVEIIQAVAPSCTESGYTEGKKCKRCSITIQEPKVIEPQHTLATIDAIPATCKKNGATEGKYCTVCNKVIEAPLPTQGSHDVVIIASIEPTCSEDGWTEGEKCADCDLTIKEPRKISAGHTFETLKELAPTCTTNGHKAGEKCTRCGYVKSGLEVIYAKHSPAVIFGQEGRDPTCTTDGRTEGKMCTVCHYILTESKVIPKLEHSPEIIAACAPTCISEGLTEGSRCSTCDTILIEQQSISKTEHTVEQILGFAATCSSSGLSNGQKCGYCGIILQNQHSLVSDGHTFDSDGKCTGCQIRVTAELLYAIDESATSTTRYIVTGVAAEFQETTIVIPKAYNGYPVVGIAPGAFEGNSHIIKVVMPKAITTVGANAFKGCSALEIVECGDFSQIASWDNSWNGGSNVKLTAISNQGKSPYELYKEATGIINQATNYTRITNSNAYWCITDAENGISNGDLALNSNTVQMVCDDDLFYSHTVTDYTSGISSTIDSFYYVDGYYYYMQEGHWYRLLTPAESVTINKSTPEILPKHFENALFYMDTTGKIHIELEPDPVLYAHSIGEICNMDLTGTVSQIAYNFTFDLDGNLESYVLTSSIQGMDPDSMQIVEIMKIHSITEFSDVGATHISAPSSYNEISMHVDRGRPAVVVQ